MKYFHSTLRRLFVALGLIVASLPAAPTAMDFDSGVVVPGNAQSSGVLQPWADPQPKDVGQSESQLSSRTAPVAESAGGAIFSPFAGSNVVRVRVSNIAISERAASPSESGLTLVMVLVLVALGASVVLSAWIRRA
jgi:hypothetical protein